MTMMEILKRFSFEYKEYSIPTLESQNRVLLMIPPKVTIFHQQWTEQGCIESSYVGWWPKIDWLSLMKAPSCHTCIGFKILRLVSTLGQIIIDRLRQSCSPGSSSSFKGGGPHGCSIFFKGRSIWNEISSWWIFSMEFTIDFLAWTTSSSWYLTRPTESFWATAKYEIMS